MLALKPPTTRRAVLDLLSKGFAPQRRVRRRGWEKQRGQGQYKGGSSNAPARSLRVSGRDGGGKSRPDYGLPNLTSGPLSVVNIRCSAFKARFDEGRCVL
jgi:hypothetical protein